MAAVPAQNVKDAELVRRMRARDESAVAELDTLYRSRIQQLAMRYVKTPEDAEEIAQDVLMKVYRRVDAFRGDAALSSWIYRITFNAAMSRLRSRRSASYFEVPERDLIADVEERGGHIRHETPDWSRMADEALLRSQVRRKLARLVQTGSRLDCFSSMHDDVHGFDLHYEIDATTGTIVAADAVTS